MAGFKANVDFGAGLGLELASSLRLKMLEKPKAAEPLEELQLQSSSHTVPTDLWEPQPFHVLKSQDLMEKTPPGVVPWDRSGAAPGTRTLPAQEAQRNHRAENGTCKPPQIRGNELWVEPNNELF